ncbi:MAG: pantetheine-phosphate adenylyltransferase [Lachnospiraceae bacterium]|nr:pantetheine-phosphate adenylyltransferase [Lachnospiraceae bacterium]
MKTAIYPGSFDPVTFGHIDLISRASTMCDKLIVAVLNNSSKTPLFSVDERVNMLKEVTKDLPNVEVTSFSGLLIDFADSVGASVIFRGLRSVSDFEYEVYWAQTNHVLRPHLDTVFLATSVDLSFVSSSAVRELSSHKGDVSAFVPAVIEKQIREKLNY